MKNTNNQRKGKTKHEYLKHIVISNKKVYILIERIVFLFAFVIIINYSPTDIKLALCQWPCRYVGIYVIRIFPEASVSAQQAFFLQSNQLVCAACIWIVAPMKQSIHCPQKQERLCLGLKRQSVSKQFAYLNEKGARCERYVEGQTTGTICYK